MRRSESSAPSGIRLETSRWKLHTASIIHHKGRKSPTGWQRRKCGKTRTLRPCNVCSLYARVRVCVCVSHLSSVLTLKLWLCREQEPRAGGGKMETLPPEGWAHTLGGDWLLAYFCLNENLWSKTVWKKYSVTCTVSELPLSACMCHCAFAFTYIKTESKVFFFFLRVPFNFQVLSAWLRKNQLLLLNYIQVFISLSVVLTSWYLTVCMKEKVCFSA